MAAWDQSASPMPCEDDVFPPPGLDSLLGPVQGFEPVRLQALRSERGVEQFNVCIAGRFAGREKSIRTPF